MDCTGEAPSIIGDLGGEASLELNRNRMVKRILRRRTNINLAIIRKVLHHSDIIPFMHRKKPQIQSQPLPMCPYRTRKRKYLKELAKMPS